jgi:8-oxo-dGTP diphosphatase
MDQFRIAVKGFILDNENKLLLIQRRNNDPHKPGKWDIPGGRLELGENPFLGLKREIKEETNLEVEIKHPIEVRHFTRDDGQNITMITFLCSPVHKNIILSEEHINYNWIQPTEAKTTICPTFHTLLDEYHKYFST